METLTTEQLDAMESESGQQTFTTEQLDSMERIKSESFTGLNFSEYADIPMDNDDATTAMERAGIVLDIAKTNNLSTYSAQSLVAGSEPSAFGKQLTKIREYITEKTGLFAYDTRPSNEPYYREEHPFKTTAQAGIYAGTEALSGLSLTTLDILTNKITGDKDLAELVSRGIGYEPSPSEQVGGKAAKTVAMFTPIGYGVGVGTKFIPAAKALKTMLNAGLTFGSTEAAIQFSENITQNKPIDWREIHLASGVGVLFGTGEVAVSMALSGFAKGFEKYWGARDIELSKFPQGATLEQQKVIAEAQKLSDIQRAKTSIREGRGIPQDLREKYINPPKEKGTVNGLQEVQKEKEIVSISKGAESTTVPIAKPANIDTKISPVLDEPIKMPKPIITVVTEKPAGESIKWDKVTNNEEGEIRTSARQADIDFDRKSLGLDSMASPERKSWQVSLMSARKQGIPAKAISISSELIVNPRPLNDVETAGLVVRTAELKKQHLETISEINKTKDSIEIKGLTAKLNQIEQEYDTISGALNTSGTEKGRALASQKLTINKDFDLISVKSRAKVMKGKDLTVKESEKITEITNKLEESNKKIDELNTKVAELQAQKTIKRGGVKRYTAMSVEARDIELKALVERTKGLLDAGCYN